MDRAGFDKTFDRYWDSLRTKFSGNQAIEYSPVNGNQRRVELITANEIRLRETTSRRFPSNASKAQLLEDFWKLYSDPRSPTDGVRALHARHGIKDMSEFKRAMFNEFAAFGGLGITIGSSATTRPVPTLPPYVHEPTADAEELEDRAVKLQMVGLERIPPGQAHPEMVDRQQKVFMRDPEVRAWVRIQSAGNCEACEEPGYETDEGVRFLEVHHIVPLSDGGPDVVSNAVAVCETCHGKLHRWKDRLLLRAVLHKKVARLNAS